MLNRFVIFLTNWLTPILSLVYGVFRELITKVDLTDQINRVEHNTINEKIHFIIPEEFFEMTPEQLQVTIDAMVAIEFTKQ